MADDLCWGFTVEHDPDGWQVHLPHQCDRWAITEPYRSVSRGQAIHDLEDFLAEGRAALEELQAGREFCLCTDAHHH